LENNILWIRKINVFSTLEGFSQLQKIKKSKYHTKSIKIKSKHNSLNFWKFWIFQIKKKYHSPKIFENQCPKSFCNFGLLSRLAQAGGGGLIIWIFTTKKWLHHTTEIVKEGDSVKSGEKTTTGSVGLSRTQEKAEWP
jgi:hypothetical protein